METLPGTPTPKQPPSAPAFTPGPWGPPEFFPADPVVPNDRDGWMVDPPIAFLEHEADARLIAKAPEMYDCLRASVEDHSPSECCQRCRGFGIRSVPVGPEMPDSAVMAMCTDHEPCWPHRLLAEVDGS